MGKKEKPEFITPVVKKYKVEVHNKSNDPAKIVIGNNGHGMETTIPGKAQWPKYWEIEFTDVSSLTKKYISKAVLNTQLTFL